MSEGGRRHPPVFDDDAVVRLDAEHLLGEIVDIGRRLFPGDAVASEDADLAGALFAEHVDNLLHRFLVGGGTDPYLCTDCKGSVSLQAVSR